MSEYLYRVSLNFSWDYQGSEKGKAPIYVVMPSKNEAIDYVKENLKNGISIKRVSCLGVKVAECCFSGSEKG